MEEVMSFVFSLAFMIGMCVGIAEWGKLQGLRWGQVLLMGIALTPIISILFVLIYCLIKKMRLVLSK